jgi:hypothetical protein
MDTTASEDVPENANKYLFSCFGPLENIRFRTASRSLIALIVSGVVLIAGLLWIYVPLVRQSWVVLLVLALFAFFAYAYPEPAVFAAQVGLLGLALAITARLLYWLIIERRMSRAVIHGASIMPADQTTATQMKRPAGSSHGDSATVPATPSVPAPNP